MKTIKTAFHMPARLKSLFRAMLEHWLRYGKFFFLVISIALAATSTRMFPLNTDITVMAFIASAIVVWRLPYANIPIKDKCVCVAWGFINYSVFMAIVSLLVFDRSGFSSYSIGMVTQIFVGTFLYASIPSTSHFLKLNEEKEGYDFFSFSYKKTTGNGFFGSVCMYLALTIIFTYNENNRHDDYLFSKTEYTKILGWEKEIINSNTYYIVDLPGKKRLAIKPCEYPKIRDINDHTKIRVLIEYNASSRDLFYPKKLEIKN